MNIDLREILAPRGRLEGTDRVEFSGAAGEPVVAECAVEVEYSQTGGAYYLHVVLGATYDTECHRCLEPVAYPLSAEFDLVARRGADRTETITMSEEDAAEGDYITIGAKDQVIPLHPYIHENLVVSVPIRALCSEDCRGLCAGCGANRNLGDCECKAGDDPRWNGLRKLSRD